MYYNKSIKKILTFFTEAEVVPIDKNQKVDPAQTQQDPAQQQDTSVLVPPLAPGSPAPMTSKRVTKIQISQDPTKEGSEEKVLAKFKSNKSTTIPTKSATTPVAQNTEEVDGETTQKDKIEDSKENLQNKTETPEATEKDKKVLFSKRVDKHIDDISGKSKDSPIHKHERKLKQDKRMKEFTGSVERDHKKAVGKSVNKDYFKKIDKKLGY